MKKTLRNYLISNSAGGDIETLSDDESLLDAGVIDSVAMIELIAFLEQTYRICVDEDDMIPENFNSIDGIAGYVKSKQAG